MRVFCPCAFPYANKGDAMLVLALHDALRRRYPDAAITFSSWDPEGDGPRYGLPVVPQPLTFDPGRWARLRRRTKRWWPLAPVAQTWAFVATALILWRTGLARRGAVRRLLPASWQPVFAEVDRCDVVVAVPGGWLLAPRATSLGYLTHVATLAVAVAARKPIVLSPASIGPFARPHRTLAAWLLRHVDVVVLREDDVDDLGVEVRGDRPRVLRGADLAFAFPLLDDAPTGSVGATASGRRMRVGISVRRHTFPTAHPDDRSGLWQRYLDVVAEVADRLQRDHGAEVVFVAQGTGPFGHDPDTSRLVAERCRETAHLTVLDEDLDLDALQRLYAGCDLFIGTRTHAAVLAARLGVPVVSIAYEAKGVALMRAMGLEAFAVDIAELDADELLALALEAHARADEQREAVRAHEPALAIQATAWLVAVDELVARRPAGTRDRSGAPARAVVGAAR
jgi:colanic acid/amylovoran biosynthesis protein